jgi:hypothetical protein
MMEMTTQRATEVFEKVAYSRSKGAITFWNELKDAMSRMNHHPDDYTMRSCFINGLPHHIVQHIFMHDKISKEHSSTERVLKATKQMEAALEYMGNHVKRKAEHAGMSNTARERNDHKDHKGQLSTTDHRNLKFVSGGKRFRLVQRDSSRRPYWPEPRVRFGKDSGMKPTIKMEPKVPSEDSCYSCGKKGHFAKNCPNRTGQCPVQDRNHGGVRTFTIKEKETDAAEDIQDQVQVDQTTDDDELPALEAEDTQYDPYESEYYLEEYEEDSGPERTERLGVIQVRESQEERLMANRPQPPPLVVEENPHWASAKIRGVIDRPKVSAKARQCLAIYAPINGVQAYVLLDTGSTPDLLSPDFAKVAGVTPQSLGETVALDLGCIGSRSSINYGCETEIRIGKKMIPRYFDIANIDCYDAIIGTAFMHEHRLVPDVYEKVVYSGGIQGE